MKELEERIRRQGTVKPGNVLKVDAFLNHQCDVSLFDHMGAEWARLFAGRRVDKILTIEASGIGLACLAARHFGNVPVVFAKKTQSINLDGDQYVAEIYSFTKQRVYPVIVAKRFLTKGEHVILIDDFLAKGNALHGLIDICHDAQVTIEGIGIAVEKGFQEGGRALRQEGYNLKSLAIVESMDPDKGTITFAPNEG
ncbi:xanthine phosphoribosyltransferase [Bifidobacterium indicum]|uniref:xanthine phosphoribosyltransferase n=1 Tax=Bifidobacterium indicum TaxID=1691 RepID=UPI0030DCDE85